MSSAARIATRNSGVQRSVAMLPCRFAVSRTMPAFRVAMWERRYVAPVHSASRSIWQREVTVGEEMCLS